MSSQQTPDPPTDTAQQLGDFRKNSDAWHIQNDLSIPQFDREPFQEYPGVVPDALIHKWDAGRDMSSGGTDLLAVGPPGSGKSTLFLNLSKYLIELNRETVVWRGSTNRSEWLPFGPYARVCLPEGVNVKARFQPRDPTRQSRRTSLDELQEQGWIREIVRYSDPVDLWSDTLLKHGFNVVYPDPNLTGCNDVLERSAREYDLEFSPDDPPAHWWIAAALARVEGRTPNYWTSLMLDEIGDIVPEHAQADEYDTYLKVELFRDAYADFRKFGVSSYKAGHVESDVHHLIRHKVRWRLTLNGTANPTSASSVVGYNTVPMKTDLTSNLDVGEGLMWTETNFDLLSWHDVPSPSSDKLVLEVGR